MKEAFQVLRNAKFQQAQQQRLNNIQQQQNIIQCKQNLALVSQLLMSNKQNTMQKDINKIKKTLVLAFFYFVFFIIFLHNKLFA